MLPASNAPLHPGVRAEEVAPIERMEFEHTAALELLSARINPNYFVPVVAQSTIYDPDSAVLAGFLDEVVPEGKAIDAALQAAAAYARLSAAAYADNKLRPRSRAVEIMSKDLGV